MIFIKNLTLPRWKHCRCVLMKQSERAPSLQRPELSSSSLTVLPGSCCRRPAVPVWIRDKAERKEGNTKRLIQTWRNMWFSKQREKLCFILTVLFCASYGGLLFPCAQFNTSSVIKSLIKSPSNQLPRSPLCVGVWPASGYSPSWLSNTAMIMSSCAVIFSMRKKGII